jgi:hypothetical protein
MTLRKRPTLRQRLWPKIADVRSARSVAHRAASWAFILAGLTAVFAVFALLGMPMVEGTDGWILLDSALVAAVATGIWRMSRAAAVFGLVVMVGEYVLTPRRDVGMGYLIATILVTLAFVNAIRATFAYHRLQKPATQEFGPQPIGPR